MKIIRSLFNGSRGPLLRKATALDWAGDPIDVENRFRPGHGERSYQQMLEHFQDYNDIVGDSPMNLAATSLALNAYMLTHEVRGTKTWILEYVEAWRQRMIANGGIIPSQYRPRRHDRRRMRWQMVWRRLWLGIHGHGSRHRPARQSQRPLPGAQWIRQCLFSDRRRPLS